MSPRTSRTIRSGMVSGGAPCGEVATSTVPSTQPLRCASVVGQPMAYPFGIHRSAHPVADDNLAEPVALGPFRRVRPSERSVASRAHPFGPRDPRELSHPRSQLVA